MLKTIYAAFLFAFIIPLFSHAQNDTTYYDTNDNKVDFMSADHYRVIFPAVDKKFKVEEHKIKLNRLTMTGYYAKINTLMYDDSSDMRDGYFIFYENGYKNEEGNYVSNKREGMWKEYYSDTDVLHMTDNFINGKREGELVSYYTNDKIKRKEVYSNDTSRGGKCFSENGTEISFTPYMQMPKPSYPLYNYLVHTLHYPEIAREANLEGRIIAKFIVRKDGSIKDAKVIKNNFSWLTDVSKYNKHKLDKLKLGIESAKQALDDEAIRVVSGMPAWSPGIKDDTPVDVSFNLPIRFKLE